MDKARDLIAEHLGVSRALIQDHVTFRDLGADSLDLVSLTMAFEEEFDLPISDELAESCTTIGDAVRLLEQQLSGSAPRRDATAELADARR